MWRQCIAQPFHLKPSSVTGVSCSTSAQPSGRCLSAALTHLTKGSAAHMCSKTHRLLDGSILKQGAEDHAPPPQPTSTADKLFVIHSCAQQKLLSANFSANFPGRKTILLYDKTLSYSLIPSCHSLLPFCLQQSIVISHTFIVSLSNCCWPIGLSAFTLFMLLWFIALHLPITAQSTQICHCQQPLAPHQPSERQTTGSKLQGKVILFLNLTYYLQQNTFFTIHSSILLNLTTPHNLTATITSLTSLSLMKQLLWLYLIGN